MRLPRLLLLFNYFSRESEGDVWICEVFFVISQAKKISTIILNENF